MSEIKRATHLIDEPPILVYKSLAVKIGVNRAIVFQQLHFLLNSQKTAQNMYTWVKDEQGTERWWVYNTFEDWQSDHFPWLSIRTLKTIFAELETANLVVSMKSVKNKSDRTKWYSIDYDAWETFNSSGQNLHDQPLCKNCTMVVQKLHDGYSETTSETTDKEKDNTSPAAVEVISEPVQEIPAVPIPVPVVEENPLETREAKQKAVCFLYGMKEPETPGQWSHLNMLVNFFAGTMVTKKGKRASAWHDYQFDEAPLNAVEIAGFKIWYDAVHKDQAKIEKPESFQTFVGSFRLSAKYNVACKRAAVKLYEMLGIRDPSLPKPPENSRKYTAQESADLWAKIEAERAALIAELTPK